MGQFDKELIAGDMKGLTKLFGETKPVLRSLLPYIPDKIVRVAVASLPDKYEHELEKVMANGGGELDVIDRFFRSTSRTLISAMSKTKPTAETLNE